MRWLEVMAVNRLQTAQMNHRNVAVLDRSAGTFRVIVTGVGRCVMIGAHVQDEEWGAFGGDCRMAG